MEWHQAINRISPHIVRISTPTGSGTGFLVYRGAKSICAVATAAHVLEDAHHWEHPMRLEHHGSGKIAFLRPPDRAIILESSRDTAALIFNPQELPLPAETLPLIVEGKVTKVGVELGWLGFPALSPSSLCFFSGRVSARIDSNKAYLVDGVAINGVSGGPAFRLEGPDTVRLVGVLSAYVPNRATGEVLPGLCLVRGVHQFQKLAKDFKSLEAAQDAESLPQPNT